MNNPTVWSGRLQDARSKQVIFLSHCLLNENTRYLGGAARPGIVREIVQPYIDQGVGLIQLPCPEQDAWGGVLKRYLLCFFGAQHSLLFRFRHLLLPLMMMYTRYVYSRLAKKTVNQIKDYLESGYTVCGIVGVDGSPSCGLYQSMNIEQALTQLGALDPSSSTSKEVNAIVCESLKAGRGLFVECLMQELQRRQITVPFRSHRLLDELNDRIDTNP